MPKWLQKVRKLQLSTLFWTALCLIAVIQLFVSYGYYNYDHLLISDLDSKLYKEINPNLVITSTKQNCNYHSVLENKESIHSWEYLKKIELFVPTHITNGSYIPADCNPQFSVAILVTYRNRQSQLDVFIPYMHNFLRRQNIHYKIYVIEQQDDKPWNKGLLYNVGARAAAADGFPCLLLHDVDLLPLDAANLYACLRRPRHLSASVDKFRHVLPYATLAGGVLAVRADHFRAVDGLSNRFTGWGGEDDDLAARLRARRLDIWRLPQNMSRYTMLRHPQERKNPGRHRLMARPALRGRDGLGSARPAALRVQPRRLYTLVAVRL